MRRIEWCEVCQDAEAESTMRSGSPLLGWVEIRVCNWCRDRPKTATIMRQRISDLARAARRNGR